MKGNTTEQMGFRLPTYPQADRDLSTVQSFLISKAFSEVEADLRKGCEFSFDGDGELLIEGPEERIYPFAGALGSALENVITEEISEQEFEKAKAGYLASIAPEKLAEKELAAEIQWEHIVETRGSLLPITKMLYSALSGLAQKPPLTLVANHANPQLFHQLPISGHDQGKIEELIKKMGDSGYFKLLRKKKKMKKLGDQVNHVHPIRFIGYVYSRGSLKARMRKILGDKHKRNGFLNGHGGKEGFAKRMNREMDNNNLLQYIPGFAQSIGVNPAAIEGYFHHRQWEQLLKALL